MNKTRPNDPCHCGSGKKFKKCCMHKKTSTTASENRYGLTITPITKGVVSPTRPVPPFIVKPSYAETGKPARIPRAAIICTPDVIARMRTTCKAAARVLQKTMAAVKPGITTDELDAITHDACIAEGGYPSPLNYHGYPKSVCTSVNEVICHGIPSDYKVKDGDIVNIDVTIFKDGVHGDTNATVMVGNVPESVQKLVECTRQSLENAIKIVKPGARVRDIGKAIERTVKPNGYSVVESFCGHGIGEEFHNSLYIPHYYDAQEKKMFKAGMIFTIEPMINMGTHKEEVWDDDWTAVTKDRLPSAQFEHTILVTETGAEILTLV